MDWGSARIRKLAYEVRASYWLVPAALVAVAMGAAQLFSILDHTPLVLELLGDRLAATPEDARSTLGLIASSTIGVAGVMFSITIVAVTFASGSFGPRLIGNFMRDRGSQWSLGILLATFVFALLVLRGVESQGPDGNAAYVPRISLLVAIGLALMSIGTMIYFVHHVPETINISNIIAALGRRLCNRIADVAPHVPDAAKGLEPARDTPVWEVSAGADGHVQAYNPEGMAQIAVEAGCRITLLVTPGRFITAREAAFRVEGAEQSEEMAEALRATLAIGDDRTEEQDVEFLIDQLVEVAIRALSPGVNDPFSAVYCMDWMLAALLAADEAGIGKEDSSPSLLVLPEATPESLVQRSLGACLPYALGDSVARAALDDILDRLERHAGDGFRDAARALRQKLRKDDPK